MHKLYISDGVVLGKRMSGEANLLVYILTREFGLIKARAQSARAEKSKLRYGLELLKKGKFTFVRGKREWHLTGAEAVSSDLISPIALRRQGAGRIAKLLLRLIHGEDVSPALYRATEEGLISLARAEDKNTAESIEALLVLRILSHLGYLPDTPELRPFVESEFFSIEVAAEAQKSRTLLIRAINESLSASGL